MPQAKAPAYPVMRTIRGAGRWLLIFLLGDPYDLIPKGQARP